MQDKENIIEKIVTCPRSLTDSDVSIILADDQLRELYEAAVSVSEAICDVPQFDTDSALAQIHGLMGRRKHGRFDGWLFTLSARRVAAIAVICIALTALATLAVIKFASNDAHSDPQYTTIDGLTDDEGEQTTVLRTSERLQYDEAPLSDIIEDICVKYGCDAVCSNDVDRQSRFHFAVPAGSSLQDVADILNAFDEVVVTVKGSTLVIECPKSN